MGSKFVWFDHVGADAKAASGFYRDLLGWQATHEGGPEGAYVGWVQDGDGPWAGFVASADADSRWVPYVQVDDLDAAAARAEQLGGAIVHARRTGPAGDSIVVADPAGAVVALWMPAAPAASET